MLNARIQLSLAVVACSCLNSVCAIGTSECEFLTVLGLYLFYLYFAVTSSDSGE
jgi:hypothetical protein